MKALDESKTRKRLRPCAAARQPYCTEILTLLVCVSVPDIAVTDIGDVNGLNAAPHPVALATMAINPRTKTMPRYLLRLRKPGPSRQSANTKPPVGRPHRIATVGALALLAAVIVNVLVSGEPEGVTLAGENEHVTPVGKPVHPNVMGELKPLSGVTVMAAVVDEPWGTIIVGLLKASVKSVLLSAYCAVVEKPGTVATAV